MTPALLIRLQPIGLASKQARISYRAIHSSLVTRASDPRIQDLGREIHDEYSVIREHYGQIESHQAPLTKANTTQTSRYAANRIPPPSRAHRDD